MDQFIKTNMTYDNELSALGLKARRLYEDGCVCKVLQSPVEVHVCVDEDGCIKQDHLKTLQHTYELKEALSAEILEAFKEN